MPDTYDYVTPTENYRRSLPEGSLEEFRIDPVDYLGIPIINVDFYGADGVNVDAVLGLFELQSGAFPLVNDLPRNAEDFGELGDVCCVFHAM